MMVTDNKKQSPYGAYKEFIDILVSDALTGGMGMRIKSGLPVLPPILVDENAEVITYRKFVESLTESQLQLFVNLLRNERVGGYHDLLAQLTYHIDLNGFGMTFNGQPMPVGIEGGLHQDFIGRLDGGYKWRENPPNR
ncbi:MAG: hypothetical protein LBE13_17960 [Bacteroidales bacterium]|jgi:hypothetical protein|nr:hypothetical protein [Bacteroidales bacterium]